MQQTVMVVEDDPLIRHCLVQVLQGEGFAVEQAANGREALDRLRGGLRPCVVLLDLMMPVMSGWEFLDEKARDRALDGVPIIVLSASGPGARAARAVATLHKPVEIDRLLAAINDCSIPATIRAGALE